ncbi:hypothetical protein JCM10207_001655 [Rhodosporidiobolus poonsookiae]
MPASSTSRLFTMVALLGLLASLAQAVAVFPRTWYPVLNTPHGDVSGKTSANGAIAYTVPYARPPIGERRFADPVPVARFSSLRRSIRRARTPRRWNGSKPPKACPQPGLTEGTSEDCLYMTVYTPPNAKPTSNLPVVFWVHGGTFVLGGISSLDASAWAKEHNTVVVTVQYRLGLLGFLKFDKYGLSGNYGLKDVIAALQFVQSDIKAYGGDPSKVTIAGQSSGAEMIKSLLVTPSATPLFARAILHSAPLDTADQPSDVANAVGKVAAVDLLGCRSFPCLKNKNVDEIVSATASILSSGMALSQSIPGLSFGEPIRVAVDGELVTRDFQQVVASGGPLEGAGKELIFTTTKNEGCTTTNTFSTMLGGLTADNMAMAIGVGFSTRAPGILSSGLYTPDASGDATEAIMQLATDFSWTCPNQQTAINATAASGFSRKVYLGEFDLGVDFDQGAVSLCSGKVDHQDDIYTLFAPPSSLTSAQQTLSDEVQARWSAFARTGSPNPSGYTAWPTVASSKDDLSVLVLGGKANGKSSTTKSQRPDECKIGSGLYTLA